MENLFSPDNKLYGLINKLFYSCWLNILWFICCIPIITIGASTSALYYVSLKIARDQEGNITKQFIKSFRDNFKKSTCIWMILLFVGIILAADGYILYHIYQDNLFWTLCFALLIGAIVIYCIVLLNIFPLFARFDTTIFATFKNALFIGVRYLFCTLLMGAIYFLMFFIIINYFTPLIVFGFSFFVKWPYRI